MKNLFREYFEWIMIVIILCIIGVFMYGCQEIAHDPQIINDSEKLVDEIIDDTIKEYEPPLQ